MTTLGRWWFTLGRWRAGTDGSWSLANGEFRLVRYLNWGASNDVYKLYRGMQHIDQMDLPSPSHVDLGMRGWAKRQVRAYLADPELFDYTKHPEKAPRARKP